MTPPLAVVLTVKRSLSFWTPRLINSVNIFKIVIKQLLYHCAVVKCCNDCCQGIAAEIVVKIVASYMHFFQFLQCSSPLFANLDIVSG